MAKKIQIEFANFICKFGSDKSLLDHALDIVIPAFQSKMTRKYGEASFFFHDVTVVRLASAGVPTLCIAGRFIKSTQLSREQIYDRQRGLIKDERSMDSAPSSLFCLALNNHKLFYMHETAHAPNLSAFRATIYKAIQAQHKELVQSVFVKRNSQSSSRVTKASIIKEIPYPSVEVIPLSSGTSLERFVNQYKVLKTVEAKLVETNDELDMDGLFQNFRSSMYDIGSKRTVIRHHNKDGLSKEAAISQLTAASAQGNTIVKLDGQDTNGDTLRGDNNNFKITVPVDTISQNMVEAASEMNTCYEQLVESGMVPPATPSEKSISIIQKINSYFTWT